MLNYKQLMEFGLDDKEAKIYLATLRLGGESVLQIAKAAKLNRVSTYEALRSLKAKGLISSFAKGKRIHYGAADPDRLSYLLGRQKDDISKAEKSLKKLMPELSSFFSNTDDKPKVTYYEGKEGLKTIQDSFLKTPDKLLRLIFLYDNVSRFFTDEEMGEYRQKRLRFGIKAKSIAIIRDNKTVVKDVPEGVQRVYLSYDKYPIRSDITIYGNKIAFASLESGYGIIISSSELADSMRVFFDMAWKVGETNI